MKSTNSHRPIRAWLILLLVAVACWTSGVRADRPGWQRRQVNWRMTGGGRIKAVNYPQEKPLPLLTKRAYRRPKAPRKKTLPAKTASRLASLAQESAEPIVANVIDSPPIDGFVPWIAVAVTDERCDELELDAIPEISVVGNYLTGYPQSDYAIGILDTGASAHVMGNVAATDVGLFDADLITSNTTVVTGVTGSVDVWVSQPIGLFIDGLGAIEPNGLLLDTSGMVGETNVAIVVGQGGSPDLPTAIGSPLSVYFTAALYNDQQITVTHNSEDFTAPDIRFYDHDDPCIPSYSNIIPLELRPLGGVSVQYIFDPFDMEFPPASPSIITAFMPTQSVFFVHSVDLTEGDNIAFDKDRFMFDTGAQVTIIGTRVAARLALDPAEAEFEVEIQGVTGDSIMAPGFYIDSIEIPALGEWLSFTNVPVILLDAASPEGGTVDGIIGMNLFVDLNFVFRGGGLFLQDDPTVEFEPVGIIADIAPEDGDGVVDFLDLAVFVEAWLATSNPPSANWNPKCDMAPRSSPDGRVDFLDFTVLAEYWLEGNAP